MRRAKRPRAASLMPLLDKPLVFAVDAKIYRIEQFQLDFLTIRSPAGSTSPTNRSRRRGHAGNSFGMKQHLNRSAKKSQLDNRRFDEFHK